MATKKKLKLDLSPDVQEPAIQPEVAVSPKEAIIDDLILRTSNDSDIMKEDRNIRQQHQLDTELIEDDINMASDNKTRPTSIASKLSESMAFLTEKAGSAADTLQNVAVEAARTPGVGSALVGALGSSLLGGSATEGAAAGLIGRAGRMEEEERREEADRSKRQLEYQKHLQKLSEQETKFGYDTALTQQKETAKDARELRSDDREDARVSLKAAETRITQKEASKLRMAEDKYKALFKSKDEKSFNESLPVEAKKSFISLNANARRMDDSIKSVEDRPANIFGPIGKKIQDFKERWLGVDPDDVAARASVTSAMVNYMKEKSGVAISDKEAMRLMSAFGSVDMTKESLLAKLKEMRSGYTSDSVNLIESTEGLTGKETPDKLLLYTTNLPENYFNHLHSLKDEVKFKTKEEADRWLFRGKEFGTSGPETRKKQLIAKRMLDKVDYGVDKDGNFIIRKKKGK